MVVLTLYSDLCEQYNGRPGSPPNNIYGLLQNMNESKRFIKKLIYTLCQSIYICDIYLPQDAQIYIYIYY